MPLPVQTTSFARLTRGQAIGVLALAALTTAFFVCVTLSPLRSGYTGGPAHGPGDIDLYHAEITRMEAGEGYYAAAAAELKPRGYPTRSPFNWRTPAPIAIIGSLPDRRLAWAALGLAAGALALFAFEWFARETGGRTALLGMGPLSGALVWLCMDELYVSPELSSGILLGLSLSAYAVQRPWCGFAAGLAALFCRELAAPYCVVCLGLAIWQRRRSEVAAWLVGFAAYAVYYAWHLWSIWPLTQADGISHHRGWICFGGAGFILALTQMNAYLLMSPQWVTALVLPLALLGVAGWNTPAGTRLGLSLAAFLITFSIVGQPFNQYWGLMFTPLVAMALVRAPASLADLIAAARRAPEMSVGNSNVDSAVALSS